jgi:hypothetical protein
MYSASNIKDISSQETIQDNAVIPNLKFEIEEILKDYKNSVEKNVLLNIMKNNIKKVKDF